MKTANPMAIALAALLPLVAGTVAVAQATPQDRAQAANRIVGTWEYEVHLFHCFSGQTLARFRAASIYHADGTMLDTNTAPPHTRGPAFGVWQYDPQTREHTTRMRLYRYNPDGSFAGASEITSRAMLSNDGNSMSVTSRGKLLDPAEQVLFESCGSAEGVRSQ